MHTIAHNLTNVGPQSGDVKYISFSESDSRPTFEDLFDIPEYDGPSTGDEIDMSKEYLLIAIRSGISFSIEHNASHPLIFLNKKSSNPNYGYYDTYKFYIYGFHPDTEAEKWIEMKNSGSYEDIIDGGDIIIKDPPQG